MLSIKAGEKIYERLQALCCGKINPEMISTLTLLKKTKELEHLFLRQGV